jgi:HD-like signal output (HDOD) protein/ActR/RegA family two-component response regulator
MMTTILVVDDMAVFREPIAAALRHRGIHTLCAEDGLDALGQLEQTRPDLILLDISMPRMDGLVFLRAMRRDPRFNSVAVILLTAISDRERIIEAGKLGVRDYLLKSRFSLDEMFTRIERHLNPGKPNTTTAPDTTADVTDDIAPDDALETIAPIVDPSTTATDALKSIKPVLPRSEINDRIEAAGELKALSPTVAQIMKITNSTSASIEQVARIIRQDQAIALKVLKLANSVVYTRGEPVESVQQAVSRIGLTQIRQVAMNMSVMDRFANPQFDDLLNTQSFWEHAIATGMIAASIVRARAGKEQDIDAAFTMGLLHDVGRMVFVEQFSANYIEVLKTAEQLRLPLEQVESRMLLVNHADLMDKLLHAWKFSKHLINPIALHHLSMSNIRSLAPRMVSEVAVLGLANRLAHAMLLGSSGNDTIYPTHGFINALRLKPEHITTIEREIVEHIHDMKFAMINAARGDVPAAIDARQVVARQFDAPFRAIFIGTEPETDAYRIFTEALAETGEDGPNIAVVHIATPSQRVTVTTCLRRAEEEAGLDVKLPVVLLSPKGNILLEDNAMQGRSHALLSTPTAIARFTKAVNSLIADSTEAAQAA